MSTRKDQQMTANRDALLAGVSGGGAGGTSLAWFAPTGSTAPTDAIAAFAAAFKDSGLVAKEGLTRGVDESTTDIEAYGLGAPARSLVNASKITFKLKFLESNPIAMAVYHRLALGAIVPDEDGAFDFTEGQARTQLYAAGFDMVDGGNHLRAYCPTVEVTGRDEFVIAGGASVGYGVTLTAYAGSDGTAVHWFGKVPAIAIP